MGEGRRGRPRESAETPSGLYRQEDALLIYAAMKENPARRSLDSGRILELAELIGRSPGSISLKVAGYRALEGGDSPRTRRVSWVQRAVRLEFGGNTKALLRTASRVRVRILRCLASPRIEWTPHPRNGFAGKQDGIAELAEFTGFPRKGWFLYSHARGKVLGVAFSSAQILADPESAARFATQLRRRVGRGARVSAGFTRVERREVDLFVRGILTWKFPSLHLRELSGDATRRLGIEVARPLIHGLVVTPRDAASSSEEDLAGFRHSIRDVLGLSPSRFCPTCLVLLGYVAGQVERKGSTHPT